ncbi:MAG: Maf family protein [Bacteroidota bacterium]|nr:Maf family protein [Bacteroidota bacterium]
MQSIILASQSPRRKQLLEWAEVPFEVIVKHTEETFSEGMMVSDVPVHIARNKAIAVQETISDKNKIILAADTVVVVDNAIIGKPKDREHAVEILSLLSGRQHEVITGVVILYGEKEIAFADTTSVVFHSLTKEQIEFYIDKYKPYDKAGAYAIQEWIGVVGIRFVSGDFYNVMGLPVSRVVKALQQIESGE